MRLRFRSERGAVGLSGLLTLVYLAIGVWVAATRDYFDQLRGVRAIVSLILAVVLWPLVLLGVDLRLGR
ncbi:MAG TPA: hypothetical protein VE915_06215 [Actinomycetota bacterium]|nr:hypothetical protein [Actinomycetota bacterium]